LNRREFTIEAALALLSGLLITVSGCETSTDPSPVYVDLTGEISSNHGHSVTLSAKELSAGGSLDLNIQGMARHAHVVSLSPSDLALLRGGARIVKESSGTRHTHLVTFQG
jgi:hypothetical protein